MNTQTCLPTQAGPETKGNAPYDGPDDVAELKLLVSRLKDFILAREEFLHAYQRELEIRGIPLPSHPH
jgi:hypothetical protein